jgi:cellulose synthase/poly-beta-1,6-N-acetylglucosamine synthase-like glycosyltransferase
MRYVFWLSLAVLIYTYAGYPALTLLLGRLMRRRVATGGHEPSITVVIAAYNEAAVVGGTIENKLALDYPRSKLQIIVVSDASTDDTDRIAQRYTDAGVLVLRQTPRRGKTAALNMAAERATGDLIVFADANSMYAPDTLRMLARNFSDPTVGYVTGRLVYGGGAQSAVGVGCRAYMAYEDLLRRSETRLGSIIGVNGGVDAVRRNLFTPMRDDQLPDFVLPLHVVRRGYRVVYEPDAILHENTLTTSKAEYRMRVRVALRAWWAMADMLALLDPRRYGMFSFQLFSHKVLRYAVFAAIPVFYAAAATLSVDGLVYQASYLLASALLILAAVGWLAERIGYSSPVLSIPYYFVLINVAAGQALVKFLSGKKQAVWTPRLG